MIRFFCLLGLLTISSLCWSQAPYSKKKSSSTSKTTSAKTNAVPLPLNVLFATNEDCELYVNDELKGEVSKSNHFYTKLPPGKYEVKAVSKATKDVLTENISVAEGSLNEIFLDLLLVVDERTAQREKEQQSVTVAAIPVSNELPFQEVTKINTIVANMVPIKGGNFVMGNNKAPSKDEAEHPVVINKLLFSKYEVTQSQWETIMGYNPSINRGCPTCPVENVSWEEVMKFIRKLNSVTEKKFRLPTEAEWEYVAKLGGRAEVDAAGGQEEYIKKTAWFFSNANQKTHPVGTKLPNAAGVYDMMGNVSEWCLDWYSESYYKEEYNKMNPEGPALGKLKVIRGGNYKDYVGDRFRPSFRNKRNPIEKGSEIGFRLVLDAN